MQTSLALPWWYPPQDLAELKYFGVEEELQLLLQKEGVCLPEQQLDSLCLSALGPAATLEHHR